MSPREAAPVSPSSLSTTTRLAIAVPAETPRAWLALVRHLGLPTIPLDGRASFDASAILLLGVDLKKAPELEARVRDRWNRGVPVVADARSAAVLTGREVLRYRADRLVGSGFAFRGLGSIAVEGPIEALRCEGRPAALSLLAQRPAPLYGLALPAADKLDPNRSVRRRIATVSTGSVQAEVPACELGRIAELLRATLIDAAAHRGHPVLCSAMLPYESAGVLAIEIDADVTDPDRLLSTASRLESLNLRASFRFRAGEALAEELVDELDRRGHECVRDRNARESWIADGESPNPTTERGLIPRPAFLGDPGRRGRPSERWDFELPPLPVPVHPVTPSDLARVGAGDSEIVEHFVSAIRDAFLNKEPIVLHVALHAESALPDVLFEAIADQVMAFENLLAMPVWIARVTELKRFWVERSRQRVEASVDAGILTIHVDGDAGVVLHTQSDAQRLGFGVRQVPMPEIPADAARDPGPSALDVARPGEQESRLSTVWSRAVRRGSRRRHVLGVEAVEPTGRRQVFQDSGFEDPERRQEVRS